MKWTFCVLIACLFLASSAIGQASMTATIQNNGKISLDDGPLSDKYEVNYTALGFTSDKAATDYFSKMNVSAIKVGVNAETKVATIHLNLKQQPNWNKAIWTAYLQRHVKPVDQNN